MLDTLLESNSRKKRSQAGVALSIAAHTGFIGAALYATAQARPEPLRPSEIVRPVYFPPAASVAAPRSHLASDRGGPLRQLRFVPPTVDIPLPALDVQVTLSSTSDFKTGAISPSGSSSGNRGNVDGDNGPFLVEQVEKQAFLAPGTMPPRYPETLRTAGIEGRVVAQFIVSEHGQAEAASIRILESTNPHFNDAVRTALGRMRFVPAEIAGKKVRQLVEMPFLFTLSR